jgi:hypothetical protein
MEDLWTGKGNDADIVQVQLQRTLPLQTLAGLVRFVFLFSTQGYSHVPNWAVRSLHEELNF